MMRYSVFYRYGVDSSYNFVMSEVDCSTSNYLVILQCSHSSFTGSCERNRDEVSVVCCESFSSYFMCLWYSCMHGHGIEKYFNPHMRGKHSKRETIINVLAGADV